MNTVNYSKTSKDIIFNLFSCIISQPQFATTPEEKANPKILFKYSRKSKSKAERRMFKEKSEKYLQLFKIFSRKNKHSEINLKIETGSRKFSFCQMRIFTNALEDLEAENCLFQILFGIISIENFCEDAC